MRFDHTFFKPQLNINIFKAKIAVNKLRVKKRTGHVREIDAIQFKDNAQISLMVGGRAQKPEVAYKGNPPRIEVVLRDPAEGKSAPAAPKGKARKIRTIIIDPGHGGRDGGAANRQLKILEKHVVLGMGLKIKKALEKRFNDVRVVITRDKDEYIALKDRIGLANKYRGDLFISVHANAIPGNLAKRSSVKGYVVYFLDVAQDEESRAVAALENSVLKFEKEESGGKVSDIDYIIKQSELNFFRNESEDFAIILEQAMDKKLKKVERRKTGVNQAWFYVLRGPEMPAVLIETAFISNPREARILKMSSFHKQVAEAVAAAVGRFKKKYE
jgi:N-acetylmuramoyl-L-alanine amidase